MAAAAADAEGESVEEALAAAFAPPAGAFEAAWNAAADGLACTSVCCVGDFCSALFECGV